MSDEERLARRAGETIAPVAERLVALAGRPDALPMPPMEPVTGLNGGGVFEFKTTIQHGSGTREVGVRIRPETMLYLAAAMAACPGARTHPAHAVWHVLHGRLATRCEHASASPACIRCGSDHDQPPTEVCRTCGKPGFLYLQGYGP